MTSRLRISRRWLWTPAVLLAAAIGSYVAYRTLAPESLPEGLLYGNGRVEGTEVRLSSEVAGRVSWSALEEGKAVSAGELLLQIDAADLSTTAARTQAESTAVAREAARLEAELRTATHHLQTATADAERYRDLEARGTVPAQRREAADNAREEAAGRVRTVEAALSTLAARRAAAGEAVTLARAQVGKTEIRAPLVATVLLKLTEPGEWVAPGQPLATLVDLTKLELKVYIRESDIGRVRLDARARVRVNAFPARDFEARVARVDATAQFTPRDVHMPDERSRLVFGVTLALADTAGILKPGMPADAWINWRGIPWPELRVPR